MMTGAPRNGVTALRGMTPLSPGRMHTRLANMAVAAPVRMVAGKRFLWFSVPRIRRAMCGTANPIKATGPQKAVVMAASRPVTKSSR